MSEADEKFLREQLAEALRQRDEARVQHQALRRELDLAELELLKGRPVRVDLRPILDQVIRDHADEINQSPDPLKTYLDFLASKLGDLT